MILTGAGRAFCAGGDLAEIWKGRLENNVADLEPLLRAGMQAVLKIRTMRQPVIAAINGAAAGAGMNIALAADIRFASDAAVFGQNFAKVGLFPDYGGTFFLPQLVGPAKAAEMFYTGDMIDAKTALQLGLVNRLVPVDQLDVRSEGVREKYCARAAVGEPGGEAGVVWKPAGGVEQGAGVRSGRADEVFRVRGLRRGIARVF